MHPVVRGFVIALMSDFSRVDDVVQEIFLTVTAEADDSVAGAYFRSWAFSIARFEVLEAALGAGI
ncbi:MAG: sigma factor [Verrucomicrobiales bacterium]|nr:sigma factor [Verrucomicrobiales bacterium]